MHKVGVAIIFLGCVLSGALAKDIVLPGLGSFTTTTEQDKCADDAIYNYVNRFGVAIIHKNCTEETNKVWPMYANYLTTTAFAVLKTSTSKENCDSKVDGTSEDAHAKTYAKLWCAWVDVVAKACDCELAQCSNKWFNTEIVDTKRYNGTLAATCYKFPETMCKDFVGDVQTACTAALALTKPATDTTNNVAAITYATPRSTCPATTCVAAIAPSAAYFGMGTTGVFLAVVGCALSML